MNQTIWHWKCEKVQEIMKRKSRLINEYMYDTTK